MQHDGAVTGATHTPVRDAHHVFHAHTGEFDGDGQIARFRHAGCAFGADVFEHQNIVCRHIQVRQIHPGREVCGVFKHDGAAFVFHQPRVSRRLFDDGTTRRQVAVQNRDAALRIDGVVEGAHHVLFEARALGFELLAQGAACHRHRAQVQQRLEFTQQRGHAPGVVEVFHVMLAAGFQIQQHGGVAAHAVQRGQVQIQAHAPGDGGQVHQAIGGAANGQQHPQGVFKRSRCEDLVDRQAVNGHLHGPRPGFFGNPDAVCRHGGRRGATGHRHAQRLGDAGHGAGGAHHRAGAHAGDQLVVHISDFFGVNFFGAELGPITTAIGAGTYAFTAVRAGQHGAGDELDGRQPGRGGSHQLGWHGFVATTDQHHGIHRLRLEHLFGVHRHQVAQEHAGGRGKTFMDADGGEIHRQAAGHEHPAFDSLDQLRRIAMAGVVGAAGVGNADHGAVQCLVGVTRAFDEGLAQKE